MTDRELLELAAKTAGEWPSPEPFEHVLCRWNPLTDDGAAFRLALDLKLNIMQGDFSAGVTNEADIDLAAFVRDDSERAAVVRRLIVEAAAATEDNP